MVLDDFLDYLSGFHILSPIGREQVGKVTQCLQLSKGTFLAEEGKICNRMYFLRKGYARGYHVLDGKEITYWFGFENMIFTSMQSFISQNPTRENIVLMEDSEVLYIQHTDLQELYQHSHELEHLGRLIDEFYYVLLEERFFSYLFRSAKERYDNMVQNTPHIIKRVPLGHVASYLGITQETLSRIRRKY